MHEIISNIINFVNMFYRRKIILALIQLLDGKVNKISLHKLLFLFTEKQKKPVYDFIPYKYGSYSYSVNADLFTMVKRGLLSETSSHYLSLATKKYISELNEEDKQKLTAVEELYGEMSAHALMKHTYRNFPYTAIKSIKAPTILTED